MVADLTQSRLTVASAADCSALGAAQMGFLGTGVHASLDALAAEPANDVEFEPQATAADAQARQDAWRKAVSRVLSGPA